MLSDFDDEDEEQTRVLSIGFSKAGMSVTRLQYEWKSIYPRLEETDAIAYYPELGADKLHQAADDSERLDFWERVTEVLEAAVESKTRKLEDMRVRQQWGYDNDTALLEALDFKFHTDYLITPRSVETPTMRVKRFYLYGDATQEEGLRTALARVFQQDVVEKVFGSELAEGGPEISPALGVAYWFSHLQCVRPSMPSWECARRSTLYNKGELGGYYTKWYERWQYVTSRARCSASVLGVK